jgi:hypothetical protein
MRLYFQLNLPVTFNLSWGKNFFYFLPESGSLWGLHSSSELNRDPHSLKRLDAVRIKSKQIQNTNIPVDNKFNN